MIRIETCWTELSLLAHLNELRVSKATVVPFELPLVDITGYELSETGAPSDSLLFGQDSNCAIVVFECAEMIAELSKLRPATEFHGVYDSERNIALFPTSNGDPGLYRSVVVGVASRWLITDVSDCAHCAVVTNEKAAIMLVGGHNAGKTTAALGISRAISGEIVHDDWVVALHTKSGLCAERLQCSKDFPLTEIEGELGVSKSAPIRSIAFIDRDLPEPVVSLPQEEGVNGLLDSSYHMPDSGLDRSSRLNFWFTATSECRFFRVNTTNFFVHDYALLANRLLQS